MHFSGRIPAANILVRDFLRLKLKDTVEIKLIGFVPIETLSGNDDRQQNISDSNKTFNKIAVSM